MVLGRFGFAIASGGHEPLVDAAVDSIRACSGPVSVVAVTFDGHQPETVDRNGVDDCAATRHLGISHAWNRSILACFSMGCEFVCVLNDDAEVPKSFVEDYLGFFARHPDVRIACSLDRLTAGTVFPDIEESLGRAWCRDKLPAEPEVKNTLYERVGGFEHFAKTIADRRDAPEFLRCRMNGACFVLRRSCLWELGLFDEGMGPPGTHEDVDAFMRCLTRLGPDAMGTCTRSFVHHLRAVTISSYPRDRANAGVAANSARYRQRWPKAVWGDIEDWFSAVNATPANTPEPPLPRPRWW